MASSHSDRDRIADERDQIADERDRMADKRDQEADERDRQAGVRESSAAAAAAPTGESDATADGLFGIDLGHHGVRADETEGDDGDEPPPVRASTKTLSERLANAAAARDRAPIPPSDEDDEDLSSED